MTGPTDETRVDDEPGADLPNLPLLDDAIDIADRKPTWRGWIHAGTFPVAIVLGVVLITMADGTAARVSSSIFVASSMLLFGVSALYHRFDWSDPTRRLLKRSPRKAERMRLSCPPIAFSGGIRR